MHYFVDSLKLYENELSSHSLWYYPIFIYFLHLQSNLLFLKKKICRATDSHRFGLLAISPLGFKARVGSLIRTLQRHTWYTFLDIHFWCVTFASVYCQHSSQSPSPHACFSTGGKQDLNHWPPAWQSDALTTRPGWLALQSILCIMCCLI